MTSPEERRHASLLAEYEGMLEKVRHGTIDLYRTETIIPLSIALFYAWAYGDPRRAPLLPWWIWLIPVGLTVLGGTRQYLRYRYLDTAHCYLRKLERHLYPDAADSGLGWDTYWEVHDRSPHRGMRKTFWILLAAATIALAIQAWRY